MRYSRSYSAASSSLRNRFAGTRWLEVVAAGRVGTIKYLVHNIGIGFPACRMVVTSRALLHHCFIVPLPACGRSR